MSFSLSTYIGLLLFLVSEAWLTYSNFMARVVYKGWFREHTPSWAKLDRKGYPALSVILGMVFKIPFVILGLFIPEILWLLAGFTFCNAAIDDITLREGLKCRAAGCTIYYSGKMCYDCKLTLKSVYGKNRK